MVANLKDFFKVTDLFCEEKEICSHQSNLFLSIYYSWSRLNAIHMNKTSELTAEVFSPPVEHNLMGHSTLPWILWQCRASTVLLSWLTAVLHVKLTTSDKPILWNTASWWHQVKQLRADHGLNKKKETNDHSSIFPVWKPEKEISAIYDFLVGFFFPLV